jgi:hypothetical protein
MKKRNQVWVVVDKNNIPVPYQWTLLNSFGMEHAANEASDYLSRIYKTNYHVVKYVAEEGK